MTLPTLFQCALPNDPAAATAGRLTPNRFNVGVVAPFAVIPLIGTTLTWTNMPTAATEFPGLYRTKADLARYDEVRLVARVGVAGTAASTLRIQYSTDQSAWVNLTATVACNAIETVVSAWSVMPVGAQADVFLRILGAGGDGALDPQFRLIQLQVQ